MHSRAAGRFSGVSFGDACVGDRQRWFGIIVRDGLLESCFLATAYCLELYDIFCRKAGVAEWQTLRT